MDKASPVDPAARTVHSFILTPEIRENAEMASIVAKMHPPSVQVNDLSHYPSLTIHTVCFIRTGLYGVDMKIFQKY